MHAAIFLYHSVVRLSDFFDLPSRDSTFSSLSQNQESSSTNTFELWETELAIFCKDPTLFNHKCISCQLHHIYSLKWDREWKSFIAFHTLQSVSTFPSWPVALFIARSICFFSRQGAQHQLLGPHQKIWGGLDGKNALQPWDLCACAWLTEISSFPPQCPSFPGSLPPPASLWCHHQMRRPC